MRDGIWKSLDLPNAYRRVARFCQQEATRGETARKGAEEALKTELKNLLSPNFLRDLRRRTNEPSLLDALGDPLTAVDALEQATATALRHLDATKAPGDRPQQALEIAIKDHLEKHIRQCEEQYARDTDPEAAVAAKAFADTIRSIDVAVFAAALVEGEALKAEPVLIKVDVDNDDLSVPR